jgi:hypothetical protein
MRTTQHCFEPNLVGVSIFLQIKLYDHFKVYNELLICVTTLVIVHLFNPKFVNKLQILERFNHLCLMHFCICMIEVETDVHVHNV